MNQPSPQTPARRRRSGVIGATAGVAAGLASYVAISAAISPPTVPAGASTASPTATASATTVRATPTRSASPLPSVTKTAGKTKVTAPAKRGIVLIEATQGDTASAGTGLVVTAQGQVLTNYHVVRSSSSVKVTSAETGHEYAAELVGRDAQHDVALLQLKDAPALDTILVDPDPVEDKDVVVVAGNAGGSGKLSASVGTVVDQRQSVRVRASSPDEPDEMLTGLIETDAHAEPGDSGGPLFDDSYEVTGMTTAGAGASKKSESKTAYAMPIDDALAAADRIRSGAETDGVIRGPRADLGATFLENRDGVKVDEVREGSAAERAGLKPGDFLRTLNGTPVESRPEVISVLDTLKPGAKVSLTWLDGDGDSRSTSVTVDSAGVN